MWIFIKQVNNGLTPPISAPIEKIKLPSETAKQIIKYLITVLPDSNIFSGCNKIIFIWYNEVDKIIFLGDYFDAWENKWPDQGENFLNICSFKRQFLGKSANKLSLNCISGE